MVQAVLQIHVHIGDAAPSEITSTPFSGDGGVPYPSGGALAGAFLQAPFVPVLLRSAVEAYGS